MHLFLRAIGFAELSNNQDDKLIQAIAQKAQDKKELLSVCEAFQRASILLPVTESTGICVYGKYIDGVFKPEYYYPILAGSAECNNEEIALERHLDKESYEVICEDIKAGVTLMFYLQNPVSYLEYRRKQGHSGSTAASAIEFSLDRRNLAEKEGIAGKRVMLSALSVGGMIILPSTDSSRTGRSQTPQESAKEAARRNLIAAARNGDQDAIENLTIDDLDTYTSISRRIVHENVLSIVDTSFMPCGVECDQYSVIGEILEIERQTNVITNENICIMKLQCNDIIFDMAVNEADLVGEPALGRRFKGNVWLQGEVEF